MDAGWFQYRACIYLIEEKLSLKKSLSKTELIQSTEMLVAISCLESLASIGKRFGMSTAQVKLRAMLVVNQIAGVKGVPPSSSLKAFLDQYLNKNASLQRDIEEYLDWLSNAPEVDPLILLHEKSKGDLAGLSNRVVDTLKRELNVCSKSDLIYAVNSGQVNINVPNLGKKCLTEIADFLQQNTSSHLVKN